MPDRNKAIIKWHFKNDVLVGLQVITPDLDIETDIFPIVQETPMCIAAALDTIIPRKLLDKLEELRRYQDTMHKEYKLHEQNLDDLKRERLSTLRVFIIHHLQKELPHVVQFNKESLEELFDLVVSRNTTYSFMDVVEAFNRELEHYKKFCKSNGFIS